MAHIPTEQELEDKVRLVRILIGDVEESIFYPLLSTEDIVRLLILEDYNVLRAARRAAISAAFAISFFTYKERTGDIEVINNASLEYKKVLDLFLNEYNSFSLPADLKPFAAGISKTDACLYKNNPDSNLSPLAQITPCLAWWTRVDRYDTCRQRIRIRE